MINTGNMQLCDMAAVQLYEMTAGHFHENLENRLKYYSLNFNGILYGFDRT